MLTALSAALLLQISVRVGAPPCRNQASVVRDSSTADSTSRCSAGRRLPVTPQVLATAFHSDDAKDLFYRARIARVIQDSSLRSYDAKVLERMSAGMNIGEMGRERLIYRQERASRVEWRRGSGARVEYTGARNAIPINPTAERDDLLSSLTNAAVVPYYPGYNALWIGGRSTKNEVDEREVVDPLADGAEAYYTYEIGESVRYALPDSTTILLRELKVRPRQATWHVVVGSLMFDVKTGQLVWASYRLAAPMDVLSNLKEQVDTIKSASRAVTIIKAVAPNMTNQVSEVTVEYSLHGGRFWLPRFRTMKGTTQMAFVRMPIQIEHVYTYSNVNSGVVLPPIVINQPTDDDTDPPDSLKGPAAKKWRDSVYFARRKQMRAFADSLGKPPAIPPAIGSSAGIIASWSLAVGVTYPCEIEKLANSPDLPKSIYDPGEEVFGAADRNQLISGALSLAAQAPFSLIHRPAMRLGYGLSMTRYNRVEGFSTGLLAEQQLGGGFVATAVGRIGAADHHPNGELSLARTNLDKTVTLTGYRRLVSASDWGNPLSFNASVSAFLYGRDEGFYYRATGAELGWKTNQGGGSGVKMDWRFFAEQQREAVQKTNYSLGGTFIPNIVATSVKSAGASVRLVHTYGLDRAGIPDLHRHPARGGRRRLDVRTRRGGAHAVRGAAAESRRGGHARRRLDGRRRSATAALVPGRSADDSRAERRHRAERQCVLDDTRRDRQGSPLRATVAVRRSRLGRRPDEDVRRWPADERSRRGALSARRAGACRCLARTLSNEGISSRHDSRGALVAVER